jgi:beta-lactamase class A
MTRRHFLQVISGGAAAGLMCWPAVQVLAGVASLEHQVNSYVQRQRRTGRIPTDETTAWSIYDFTTGRKLVSINESRPFQAASMIKPFVAQAYFFRHQTNKRRYPYDRQIRLKMQAMIRDSNNQATNFFINRVGANRPVNERPREVERVLKRHAGGIFQHTSIVEYIPSSGRTYRNKASAHDYSRFLYAMHNNRLPYVSEIKRYMGMSNRNRIQDAAISQSCRVYHKTGTTAHLCGDMGILVAKDCNGKLYPYTFIGIIQKDGRAPNYGGWMRDRGNVIREVSALVYDFMRRRYNLV